MGERISFDRTLYLPEAVAAAAEAYADFAKIQITTGAEAVVAEIGGVVDHDEQTVIHAFCNHVLHETIARRRLEGNA